MSNAVAEKLKLARAGEAYKENAAGCPVTAQPVTLANAELGDVELPDTAITTTETVSVASDYLDGKLTLGA